RELLANAKRMQDTSTLPGVHYIDNRLRILDTLGIGRTEVAGVRAPRVYLRAESRSRAAELVGSGPYWVFHAFAADPYKVWPAGLSRAFLERARAKHPGHAVVLTGAKRERAALELLAEGIPGVRVIAGRASLVDTAAVLAAARCVVAPDTGMLHLAGALDRPVVGLYAPTFASLVGPRAATARPIVIQK